MVKIYFTKASNTDSEWMVIMKKFVMFAIVAGIFLSGCGASQENTSAVTDNSAANANGVTTDASQASQTQNQGVTVAVPENNPCGRVTAEALGQIINQKVGSVKNTDDKNSGMQGCTAMTGNTASDSQVTVTIYRGQAAKRGLLEGYVKQAQTNKCSFSGTGSTKGPPPLPAEYQGLESKPFTELYPLIVNKEAEVCKPGGRQMKPALDLGSNVYTTTGVALGPTAGVVVLGDDAMLVVTYSSGNVEGWKEIQKMSDNEALLHYEELQHNISTLLEPTRNIYRLVIGQ